MSPPALLHPLIPLGSDIFHDLIKMACLCPRWKSAFRAASSRAWSWRWPTRAARTPTGWPPSSPPADSCCCCATAATARTARPTSGATSWRRSCTLWAGAPRTTRRWCLPKVRGGFDGGRSASERWTVLMWRYHLENRCRPGGVCLPAARRGCTEHEKWLIQFKCLVSVGHEL